MDKYRCKWVSLLFRQKRWAITLGQITFYSVPAAEVGERWRRHEDCHKRQWKREGWFKFAVKYLWFNITRGYRGNPYELEARASE